MKHVSQQLQQLYKYSLAMALIVVFYQFGLVGFMEPSAPTAKCTLRLAGFGTLLTAHAMHLTMLTVFISDQRKNQSFYKSLVQLKPSNRADGDDHLM